MIQKYQNRSKGFSRINKVLDRTAKRYHLEAAQDRQQTLSHWQAIASSFLEEAALQTKALDFKKGVLTVACLSREVAIKIKLLAQIIMKALNEYLGSVVVFAIHLEA